MISNIQTPLVPQFWSRKMKEHQRSTADTRNLAPVKHWPKIWPLPAKGVGCPAPFCSSKISSYNVCTRTGETKDNGDSIIPPSAWGFSTQEREWWLKRGVEGCVIRINGMTLGKGKFTLNIRKGEKPPDSDIYESEEWCPKGNGLNCLIYLISTIRLPGTSHSEPILGNLWIHICR